jgi:hypothetical protein
MQEKIEHSIVVFLVILNFAVSALDILGLLDSIPWLAARVPTITLLTVGSIAGHLLLEKIRSKEAERRFIKEIGTAIMSVHGVEVRVFTTEELYKYVRQRILDASTLTVYDLSWGIETREYKPSEQQTIDEYMKAVIQKCNKDRRFSYHEVMTFPSYRRYERAKFMIDQKLSTYHLRYYDYQHPNSPPLLQFVVINSDEVIFGPHKTPYLPSIGETYLAVKQPDIVRLFREYYESIWQGAKVIQELRTVNYDVLEGIRQSAEIQESRE